MDLGCAGPQAGGGCGVREGLVRVAGIKGETGEAHVPQPIVGLFVEPGGFFDLLVLFEAPAEVIEGRGVLGIAGEGAAEFGGGEVTALDVIEIVAAESVVGFGAQGEESGGGGGLLREEFFLPGEVIGIGKVENGFAVARVPGFLYTEFANGGKGVPNAEKFAARAGQGQFEGLRVSAEACDDESHNGDYAD